jgi:2-hydroxychromene-2-carboxylate isomerase
VTGGSKTTDCLSFYFSFRSPYAWLAFHRLGTIVDRLPVAVEYIPLFPPKLLSGDLVLSKAKSAYVAEDVGRLADAYGLGLRWPKPFDTDWKRPHASFLFALDQGRAVEFGQAAFTARFSRGEDLGDGRVLAAVAERCGLAADAVLRSADGHALQRRLLKGVIRGQRAGLFGVPFFVYRDKHYWGNDRLEWLLRDVAAVKEIPLSDLAANVFACPSPL